LNRSAACKIQGESLVLADEPAQDAPGSAQAAWREQTGCLRPEGKSSLGK